MAVTDITICNNALVLIGGTDNAIVTFQDDTREARICAQLYPGTRDFLVSVHPWKFSLAQQKLAQLSTTPLFGFDFAYQLPTDPKSIQVIKASDGNGSLLSVFTGSRGDETQSYRILEDMLYTNSTAVDILFQFIPLEATFPPYFTEALEFAIAEKLAFSLEQSDTLADRLSVRKDQRLKKARHIDSRNDPPFSIPGRELALTSVR